MITQNQTFSLAVVYRIGSSQGNRVFLDILIPEFDLETSIALPSDSHPHIRDVNAVKEGDNEIVLFNMRDYFNKDINLSPQLTP
jgi:hypothetical protein